MKKYGYGCSRRLVKMFSRLAELEEPHGRANRTYSRHGDAAITNTDESPPEEGV